MTIVDHEYKLDEVAASLGQAHTRPLLPPEPIVARMPRTQAMPLDSTRAEDIYSYLFYSGKIMKAQWSKAGVLFEF